jgi:hypothetical protein
MRLSRFLFVFISCATSASSVFGKVDRDKPPEVTVNFRLLVWAHAKSQSSSVTTSFKTGEPTEVRFHSAFHYRDGNVTKELRLLPGKPSKNISYAGDATLSFFSNPNLESPYAFSISFDPRWKEVLLLLYPKTSSEKTFNCLPVFRPIGQPSRGIAVNLTGNQLSLSVDGRQQRLPPWKPTQFPFSIRNKDHVRFGVNVIDYGKTKPLLSVKKFFDSDDSPILLLRREAFRDSKGRIKHGKLMMTTL